MSQICWRQTAVIQSNETRKYKHTNSMVQIRKKNHRKFSIIIKKTFLEYFKNSKYQIKVIKIWLKMSKVQTNFIASVNEQLCFDWQIRNSQTLPDAKRHRNPDSDVKPQRQSFDKKDSKKSRFIAEIEERFEEIERECAISEKSESTHSQEALIQQTQTETQSLLIPQTLLSVRTLNNQLVRLLGGDEGAKIKQGALEYNAYLIKNLVKDYDSLTDGQRQAAMGVLYLNLTKLALSADMCEAKNIERDSLLKSIRLLQEENEESYENFVNELENPLIVGGNRLNRLARACNQNATDFDTEFEQQHGQVLYEEYNREKLQKSLEYDLQQVMLCKSSQVVARLTQEQEKQARKEKKALLSKKSDFIETLRPPFRKRDAKLASKFDPSHLEQLSDNQLVDATPNFDTITIDMATIRYYQNSYF